MDSLEHRQQFIIAEELPDGIYYINLQVKNVAGLVTVAYNPVKADSSLSERPIVWDDGEFTTNNNELHLVGHLPMPHRWYKPMNIGFMKFLKEKREI